LLLFVHKKKILPFSQIIDSARCCTGPTLRNSMSFRGTAGGARQTSEFAVVPIQE